jgi:hypothetical protein
MHGDKCGRGGNNNAMSTKEFQNVYIAIQNTCNLSEPPEEGAGYRVLANGELVCVLAL